MTEIEQLQAALRPDPKADPYTAEDMTLAAHVRSRTVPVITLAERVLEDGARYGYLLDGQMQYGGFTYGGEESNGKRIGAVHVYDQRSVYAMAPNPAVMARWIDDQDEEKRYALIQSLVEKVRPDWRPGWIRSICPELIEVLDADPEGYRREEGDYSLEVRATAPDETKHEVKPVYE